MSRAGTGARDQVARLLALLPLLHAKGDLEIAEAAQALGTTSKQVLKDLNVLWMCGLPGGYPDDLIDIDMDALTTDEGDGRIRVWNAEYLTRPVRLSPVEATALLVALRTMRESGTPESHELLDRALAKLSAAVSTTEATASISIGAEQASTRAEHRAVLAVAKEAITAGRRLDLAYWVPSRDERTQREVEPLALHVVDGVHYLEAFCLAADDLRRFRIDRILEATVLDTPVEGTVELPGTPLAERLFVPADDDPVVTLHLGHRARWIATYYPVLAAREEPDGGVSVDLVVQDRRWLTQLVLRHAPDVRVADATLHAEIEGQARAALALYPENVRSAATPGSPQQA